ncbi:MAG: hypothetical protein ACPIOQ_84580, partial [Promethearchaeia archaeon]
MDRLTHSRSRGFGFITFDSVEVAEEAAKQKMFQFNDRMVEIKRAQNLNSRSKQAQAQAADKSIRGRVANCQVNGRGARPHGMGRGM